MNEEIESNAKLTILSELIFTLLPIVALLIIFFQKGSIFNIIYTSDLSFVSIVLIGQTIVKITAGLSKSNVKKRYQLVSLIISSLIVFGLLPSIAIMVIINLNNGVHYFFYFFQIILFIISIIIYYILGTLGQIYLDNFEKGDSA
ncbi:hypothetical protein ACO2KH_18260 [Leptospira terpstrae]|uniref:hypothetical protein n=1 Tax=Leptospira terpstrae TaxID=293075 RepID=UPI003D04A112